MIKKGLILLGVVLGFLILSNPKEAASFVWSGLQGIGWLLGQIGTFFGELIKNVSS